MKNTVNISSSKLNEIRTSLQKALEFIDGLQQKKEKKPLRISAKERRKLKIQQIVKDL